MRKPSLLFVALSALATGLPAQAVWSRLYPPQSPPGRIEALMANVESTGDTMMLFGSGPSGTINDCWRFDGTTWSQVLGTLPPARGGAAMVFDANRQRLVLFGGNNSNYLQDTWEWNGTQWSNRTTAIKPAPRYSHRMAFDRRRGVTVLFSGLGQSQILQDLWEWNGTTWSQRLPTTMPAARVGHHLAFDPANESILLFAGNNGPQHFTDTWSWDGTSWLQRTPTTVPTPHSSGRVVSDLHRRRVTLFGGDNDPFTWEWNGTQWNVLLQSSPGNRSAPTMTYDAVHRRTVLFDGYSSGQLADTWTFETPNPASAVPFGAGCAGSAGVPQLANAPFSLPWLGDTFTNRATNLALTTSGVVFATGFASTVPISLAPFGMPGCDQLVIPATSEFRIANNGSADWTLSIPLTMALANVHLFQQVFALDATANAAGLSASNGSELTTGIR